MQYLFYDTCSLLDQGKYIFEKQKMFYISSITLKELEYIKTSASKDQDIKYKARRTIELLAKYEHNFGIITYEKDWDKELENYPVLSDNNDSKIILSALHLKHNTNEDVLFITQDYFCKRIAAAAGLTVEYILDEDLPYTGYIEVTTSTDEELANFYNLTYSFKDNNSFDLLKNQYLILRDNMLKAIDYYKYDGEKYCRVPDFYCFESKQFGKVKPKDEYQLIAMDSLMKNKITVLRGPAGSGKSYLSMAFLFNQLEKGNIDKILIFCNTVAANGAAKLG